MHKIMTELETRTAEVVLTTAALETQLGKPWSLLHTFTSTTTVHNSRRKVRLTTLRTNCKPGLFEKRQTYDKVAGEGSKKVFKTRQSYVP